MSLQPSKPLGAAWWMWWKTNEFKGGSTANFASCQGNEPHKSTTRIKLFSKKTNSTHQ